MALPKQTAALRKTSGMEGIPVARRSRGWRFLLSTADETRGLCDATVDGEMVVAGVAGDICNMRELESAALVRIGASNDGVLERIRRLHAFPTIETREEDPAIPGVTESAVEYALAAMGKQPEKGDKRVVSEDWGDMDEADW